MNGTHYVGHTSVSLVAYAEANMRRNWGDLDLVLRLVAVTSRAILQHFFICAHSFLGLTPFGCLSTWTVSFLKAGEMDWLSMTATLWNMYHP